MANEEHRVQHTTYVILAKNNDMFWCIITWKISVSIGVSTVISVNFNTVIILISVNSFQFLMSNWLSVNRIPEKKHVGSPLLLCHRSNVEIWKKRIDTKNSCLRCTNISLKTMLKHNVLRSLKYNFFWKCKVKFCNCVFKLRPTKRQHEKYKYYYPFVI